MRRKIAASMPVLLESAPLLAHTIFQALEFDHALLDMYQLGDGQQEENSVANVILGNTEWFEAWKEMERTGELPLACLLRLVLIESGYQKGPRTSTTTLSQQQTPGNLPTKPPPRIPQLSPPYLLFVCATCSRAYQSGTGHFRRSAIECLSSLVFKCPYWMPTSSE